MTAEDLWARAEAQTSSRRRENMQRSDNTTSMNNQIGQQNADRGLQSRQLDMAQQGADRGSQQQQFDNQQQVVGRDEDVRRWEVTRRDNLSTGSNNRRDRRYEFDQGNSLSRYGIDTQANSGRYNTDASVSMNATDNDARLKLGMLNASVSSASMGRGNNSTLIAGLNWN